MVASPAVGTRSNLTNRATANLGWSYEFEPSIAITTGRINKLGLSIRSFREPLTKSVREVMVHSIGLNFDLGGRPSWEPLSENTWRRRIFEGYASGGPLVKTGTLERVATQINIWTISATSATIRDIPQRAWYGKVHQAGAQKSGSRKATGRKIGGIFKFDPNKAEQGRGYVNIPQRQFLIIQPEDRKYIVEIFREWLEKKVDRAMR